MNNILGLHVFNINDTYGKDITATFISFGRYVIEFCVINWKLSVGYFYGIIWYTSQISPFIYVIRSLVPCFGLKKHTQDSLGLC